MNTKFIFILTFCILITSLGYSQYVPEHVSSNSIYDLLDELATEGIIDLNSTIKPYSKELIANKLLEAKQSTEKLSRRQISEIDFYLNEYSIEQKKLPNSHLKLYKNKHSNWAFINPAFTYNDSVFRCKLSPIIGMNIINNENGRITQRRYGADFSSYIGSYLSIYGTLRDVSQQGELLVMPEGYRRVFDPTTSKYIYQYTPEYKTNLQGGSYKIFENGGDYSEMRGGIVVSNKWGRIGLVKDHVIWGDNYNGSNILSGRSSSFPMITLNIKPTSWLDFNFFHAWLVSNVIDSSDFYIENTGDKKYRFRNKYMAANFFTLTPIKGLNLSFGNSIIYSEKNVQPAYLIPLMFYKSIDHTLTMGVENQNSQMFMNISSRNIKHLHLFSSIFFDEFAIARIKKSNPEQNPYSIKVGARISNFPIKNLIFISEFTKNKIIIYKHSIPSLTFSSSGYNLGHYLGDNSLEQYYALQFKPFRGIQLKASYLYALHGNEYNYIRSEILNVISQPFLKNTTWRNETYSFDLQYEIIPHAIAMISLQISDIKGFTQTGISSLSETITSSQGYLDMFTPKYLQGKTSTINVGFNYLF